MDDESKDESELFDGVEEAKDKDRPAWKSESPFEEVANILLWKALEYHTDEPLFEPQERPRGILSKADREFLYGMKDYAHNQSKANRKQDIRERIKHGLIDFKLLWGLLGTSEREQVFEEMGDNLVDECIESMVTFAYLGLKQDIPRFEDRIERGILAGANSKTVNQSTGKATNVDVSIDIDYSPDLEELYNQLQEDGPSQLTPEEVGILAKAGKLDPEDLEAVDESKSVPSVYFGQ